MNCVNLIGRACAAPVIRYTATTNRPVAEFTLAYDDHLSKDPQTNKPRSYFFLIVIWGQKAETAAQYIVKGQKVGITGRLTQESFTPQGQDKPVTKTRINADSFDLLERPANHQSTTANRSEPSDPSEEPDHIPF